MKKEYSIIWQVFRESDLKLVLEGTFAECQAYRKKHFRENFSLRPDKPPK